MYKKRYKYSINQSYHFSYRILYDVHNTDVHCTLYIAYNLYTSSIMYGFIVCSIQYSTVQFRTMYGIPFGPYIVRWHSIRGVVYRMYRVYTLHSLHCILYTVQSVHSTHRCTSLVYEHWPYRSEDQLLSARRGKRCTDVWRRHNRLRNEGITCPKLICRSTP